jgi:hypothetical protein
MRMPGAPPPGTPQRRAVPPPPPARPAPANVRRRVDGTPVLVVALMLAALILAGVVVFTGLGSIDLARLGGGAGGGAPASADLGCQGGGAPASAEPNAP